MRYFTAVLVSAVIVNCADDHEPTAPPAVTHGGLASKKLPPDWTRHSVEELAPDRHGEGSGRLFGSVADLVWEPALGTGLGQDDDDCDLRPIGFSFMFYGLAYENVWINSNGNVTFNACEVDWWHPDIPDEGNVIIAPLYGDFDPEVAGEVYFNTLGTAPNRRFVATWNLVPEYSEERDPSLPPSTFQVWLFEGSNMIQFGYNGLGTDAIQWEFDDPSTDALMDVGISSGSGSFIRTARGGAILAIDGSNVCYVPQGAGYIAILGPCESGPPGLTCNPNPVVRGDPITCRVAGSDVVVTRWEFSGTQPNTLIERVSDDREWTGIAVQGGEVAVDITVAGKDSTLQGSFDVDPRTGIAWGWDETKWFIVEDVRPLLLLGPGWNEPVQPGPVLLGVNCHQIEPGICGDLRWVQPDLAVDPNAGYDVSDVNGGPNNGLWYVTSVDFIMDRLTGINPNLLLGGKKYVIEDADQAQDCRSRLDLPPSDTLSVDFYTFNDRCAGVEMDDFVSGVLGHEGFGTGGQGNGHEAQARGEAQRERNDIYRFAEVRVHETEDQLRDALLQILEMQDRIQKRAKEEPEGNWMGRVWLYDEADKRFELGMRVKLNLMSLYE